MIVATDGMRRVDGATGADENQEMTQLAREPDSIEETGIDAERLVELALKTFFARGQLSCRDLAESMALPAFIAQELIDHLRHAKLLDVVVGIGHDERVQRYALTSAGGEKANAAFRRNRYVGPTPVPLEDYCAVMRGQARRYRFTSRADLQEALAALVLPSRVVDEIGPAIRAGRSLLVYGPSGNGKTTLAEAIGTARGGDVLVPYAILAKGEIIRVFDPAIHQIVDEEGGGTSSAYPPTSTITARVRRDQRWARVRRPLVMAGGELTIDQLELSYNPNTGIHQAPHQLKANGGTFLIDDFGRQRVQPGDLLNRWIVPLEKGYDHLRLTSGDVVELPFDSLVIFSTNLAPADLVDEAFLRRIKYTIEMLDPTPDEYHEIFRRCCERADLAYDAGLVDDLIARYYQAAGRAMRSCHPRDVIERVRDRAAYEGSPAVLTREALAWACEGYFQLHV